MAAVSTIALTTAAIVGAGATIYSVEEQKSAQRQANRNARAAELKQTKMIEEQKTNEETLQAAERSRSAAASTARRSRSQGRNSTLLSTTNAGSAQTAGKTLLGQ